MTDKKVIVRNSFVGILQFIAVVILTFVSVPIFIGNLGIEQYGVFALLTIVGNLNYFSLLGLNNALLVFLSSQGRCTESNRDIIVTSTLSLGLAILINLTLYILREFIIVTLLSVPSQYLAEADTLYTYLICANILLMLGQVGVSIIDSQQKIYITNIVQFTYNLIYWGGLIVTVLLGYGLNVIGIPLLLSALVWFVAIALYAKKIWGKVELNGAALEFKRVMKKQVNYGVKIFVSGIFNFLIEPISKMLLSRFIGLDVVGFYDIAIKIRHQASNIFLKAFYPIFPYIAEAPKGGSLNKSLIDITKKIHLFVYFLSLITLFTLPVLVKLWLGDEYQTTILIYVSGLLIANMLTSPPILPIYYYLQAKLHPEKNLYIHIVGAVINVVSFFIFYKSMGTYAILISNILATTASYILGVVYIKKFFESKLSENLSYILQIAIWCAVTFAICGVIYAYIPSSIFDVIIYPVVAIATLLIFTKRGYLITPQDTTRYLGSFSKINGIANKILFK